MTETLEAPQVETPVSYGTEAERRISEMAEQLREAGWRVTITVTFHPGLRYEGQLLTRDLVTAFLKANGDEESLYVAFSTAVAVPEGRRRTTFLSYANRIRWNMDRPQEWSKKLRNVKAVNWEIYCITRWHRVTPSR